jgi:uncharacterized protein YbaP (TraB family)
MLHLPRLPRLPLRFAPLLALAGLLCLNLNARAQDCPPPFTPPTQAELAQLARTAQDRGFLWRIEKNGVTSYLYGTLHVQKRDWFGLGPRLRQALQSANALALELDPGDPEILKQLAPPPADAPVNTALPEPLRERLHARMQTECVDSPTEQALQKQPPQMQLLALDLLVARRGNLQAAFGSEITLAATARSLGKPVVSLETVAEQLDALQLTATDAELAALVAQGLDELDSGAALRVATRLAAAWAASDDAPMLNYKDWCECLQTEAERTQFKHLLDERNPRLAGRIDALHGQRGPLLVGIGALHMFGPGSLPELLQARGFTVARVF